MRNIWENKNFARTNSRRSRHPFVLRVQNLRRRMYIKYEERETRFLINTTESRKLLRDATEGGNNSVVAPRASLTVHFSSRSLIFRKAILLECFFYYRSPRARGALGPVERQRMPALNSNLRTKPSGLRAVLLLVSSFTSPRLGFTAHLAIRLFAGKKSQARTRVRVALRFARA